MIITDISITSNPKNRGNKAFFEIPFHSPISRPIRLLKTMTSEKSRHHVMYLISGLILLVPIPLNTNWENQSNPASAANP